jgi:peptidoglycan hydrolase-like protein with peptidoglycan-binding domain
MPLISHLFRGDKALDACLVQDAAHVTLGARGVHVAKIQAALTDLDGAIINAAELSSKHYGPSTAAAVLSFKQKRQIVNRAYQTQPDNIVGKMTIAAMDAELVKKQEPVPPRFRSHCRRA